MSQLARLQAGFDLYTRYLVYRAPRAVFAAGKVLLADSLNRVPRDTEALARSGSVRLVGIGFDAQCIVGYGNRELSPRGYYWSKKENKYVYRDVASYAVYVHENVNQPAGNAFYLSHAVISSLPEMAVAAYQQFQI